MSGFAVWIMGLLAIDTPHLILAGSDGQNHSLPQLIQSSPWTVLVFFSADCPCQRNHDGRLTEMAQSFAGRGVQFFAVDSEVTSTPEKDAAEAASRHYVYPILRDTSGQLARAFEVEFATTTVVLDSKGAVHYQGGIDSNHHTVTAGATRFLRDALSALLLGVEPTVRESKPMGCYLRLKQ